MRIESQILGVSWEIDGNETLDRAACSSGSIGGLSGESAMLNLMVWRMNMSF